MIRTGLKLVGIAGVVSVIAGCCSRTYVTDCPGSEKIVVLERGDISRTIRVKLKEKCNPTGIEVIKDYTYRFSVSQQGAIADGPIKCLRSDYENEKECKDPITPEGFTTTDLPSPVKLFMWLGEWARPIPDGKWLELVGTIGRDDKDFYSVMDHTGNEEPAYKAVATGELFLLANDYPFGKHYINNQGELLVTVTCVDSAKGNAAEQVP